MTKSYRTYDYSDLSNFKAEPVVFPERIELASAPTQDPKEQVAQPQPQPPQQPPEQPPQQPPPTPPQQPLLPEQPPPSPTNQYTYTIQGPLTT